MIQTQEIRELLLIKNDFQKAVNILTASSCLEPESKRLLAQAYYGAKEFKKAAHLFFELGERFEQGYCELMQGNIDIAREIWYVAPESSPVCWGRSLVGLIDSEVEDIPTFLQIRNYLESDLYNFLSIEKYDYFEKITAYDEFLVQVNAESYKFIGRALMNNGFLNQAFDFFMKSQNILPQDPEIYYHLAQYSYHMKSYEEVFQMISLCLELSPAFTPAKLLKEKTMLMISN